MKPRIQLRDRKANAVALHVGVAHSSRPDEIGSADLTPDKIVRMVDDTHLIGFGVPHAKLDVVMQRRALNAGGVRGHVAKIVGKLMFVKRVEHR